MLASNCHANMFSALNSSQGQLSANNQNEIPPTHVEQVAIAGARMQERPGRSYRTASRPLSSTTGRPLSGNKTNKSRLHMRSSREIGIQRYGNTSQASISRGMTGGTTRFQRYILASSQEV